MKRIVLSLLFIFVIAGFVFAQNNIGVKNGNGNNSAYYNCPYPDCPLCTSSVYGPKTGKKGMAVGEPVIITAEQAKNAVEKYIQNLKGYYIDRKSVV